MRTRGHDAAGGDDGGDFNPHDVDAKGADSCVGNAGGVEFGECQATFGANEEREGLLGGVLRTRVGLARGVGDDEAGQGKRFSECSGRRDFHEPCAGGLLERLFADAREAGDFGIARVDDAALAHEWRPCRDADLREAVDHLLEGVALGHGGTDVEARGGGGLERDGLHGGGELPLAAQLGDGGDGADGAMTETGEDVEGVGDFKALDADGVMGFWSGNGEDFAGRGGGMGLEDAMWHGPGTGKWRGEGVFPMVQVWNAVRDERGRPMASEQDSKQRGPQGEEPAAKTDDLEQQVEELLREVDASERTLTATMVDEPAQTDIDAAALEAAADLAQETDVPAGTGEPEIAQAGAGGEDMESLVDELLASVNNGDATAEMPPASIPAATQADEAVDTADVPAAEAIEQEHVAAATTPDVLHANEPVSGAAEVTVASSAVSDEVATPDALDAASEAASEAAPLAEAASDVAEDESIPATVDAVSDEPAPAAVAQTTADESLDALDSQIAASADEELANATPAQLLGVPETELAEALVKPAPAPKVPAPKVPEPAAVKTEVKPAEVTQHAAKEKVRKAAGWLGHALEPYAAKAAALAAKPLANKPKSVKGAAAMIAANTTLAATVFWGYLIFFRPTQPAAAQAEPFDFTKSGLPSPERHDEHGAHGKADAAAADGHGEAKDAKGGKDGAKPIIDSKPKHLLNEVEAERAKASKGGKAEAKKGGH